MYKNIYKDSIEKLHNIDIVFTFNVENKKDLYVFELTTVAESLLPHDKSCNLANAYVGINDTY